MEEIKDRYSRLLSTSLSLQKYIIASEYPQFSEVQKLILLRLVGNSEVLKCLCN